jgi:hypothetical protein
MPYLISGVPTAAPVADLTPVSAFAQFCRMPHYTGQPLRGFIPGTLSGHAFVCPNKVPLHLPSDPTDDAVMKPLGTVGTVVGKNYSGVNGSKKGTSSVHFAEPRMLTHRERVRATAWGVGAADEERVGVCCGVCDGCVDCVWIATTVCRHMSCSRQ